MSNEQNTLSPAHIENGEEVEVVAWQHPQYPERLMTADHKAYNESRDGAPATVAKPYTVALMTVAQHQRMLARSEARSAERQAAAEELARLLKQSADEYRELRAALSAPPAAGVPEGISIERDMMGTMHIKIGDFDYVQVRYQHPYTDNASTRQLAERIAALIAAPTPPASEQQRAVVMPEKQVEYVGDRDHKLWATGANWMLREFLRLNPHLAKGEGV